MSEPEVLIRDMIRFMTTKRGFDEDEAYELFAHIDDWLKRQVAIRAHPHRGKFAVIQGGKS